MSEPTGRELVEANYRRMESEIARLEAELAQAREMIKRLNEIASATDITGDWSCWCETCCAARAKENS